MDLRTVVTGRPVSWSTTCFFQLVTASMEPMKMSEAMATPELGTFGGSLFGLLFFSVKGYRRLVVPLVFQWLSTAPLFVCYTALIQDEMEYSTIYQNTSKQIDKYYMSSDPSVVPNFAEIEQNKKQYTK